MASDPVLQLHDLTAGYKKESAIRSINLSAREGEVVGLVGANGAGKTTLMRAILGKLRIHSGRISVDGSDITYVLPHIRVRQGIAYVAQGGRVFPNLTVAECLLVAGGRSRNDDMRSMVFEIFPKVPTLLRQRAGSLSGGERQMLALSMALIQRPRILLLDEPSTGLAPNLVSDMMLMIASIGATLRLTVLLAEQNVKAILPVVSRLVVLRTGDMVGEMLAESVKSDDDLRAILL